MIFSDKEIVPGVKVELDDHISAMEICTKGRASWEKYGENGTQILGVSFHNKAINYLSIDLEEIGEKSRKRTFIYLSPEQAKELIKFLAPFTNAERQKGAQL